MSYSTHGNDKCIRLLFGRPEGKMCENIIKMIVVERQCGGKD